ncbi:Acyltransferase family [Vibrio sp. B1ASS3]|uniref:acyltransferase family protein n=1 Tax=Vibrio sp. B1ASS3 TaxID=2751176 RepID=UPI001ABAE802|nr:acyltransferase family protein [Vibrio sp. B1ASS3]CAD7822615.1 Acyltransferase family [Vibrio sp. B1ASS3]CAE6948248.1 Acyltransferase family [Vibrio sp. B1ASS3]
MQFRYDINGLRAIAVIAVVLFHFNPAWVPGGFAGVDVFFVISGFLMTGIIFRGLENDNFSLFKFYVARANRIIPALAVLCSLLLVFGWFYLTPLDYSALGKHVASSMGFLSNVIYWRESGYFDAASHEKWLLHTWSLSVEWQFYILYPVVLVALKKFLSLENLKRLIVIGTVLGFCLSVIATMKWPNPAYYLLPTRAWEMMMGGVAFLYPWSLSESRKKAVELTGLALILGSYAFVSSDTPWPGYFALLPVLGAYLMIVSNQQSSFITNNSAFQYLGKWSYSIYLWHWPIVVYGYYFDVQWWVLYGLPLSITLGFVSFKLVEGVRFKSFSSWHETFKVKPIYMGVVIGALSGFVFVNNGVNYEFRSGANTLESKFLDKYHPDNYLTEAVKIEYREECNFFDADAYVAKETDIDKQCVTPTGEKKFIGLLWGDSHAQALSYGLRNQFSEMDLLQVASSGCRPLVEMDSITTGEFKNSCDRSNEKAFKALVDVKPDFVFLAQHYDHDLNNYMKIVEKAREYNISSKFILIGPVPQWRPSLPKAITMKHMSVNEKQFKDSSFLQDLFRIDDELEKKYSDKDLTYISLLDYLCDDTGCIAKVDDKNTPIVWDYGHLTLQGSNYVVQNIIKPKVKIYLP